MPGLFQARAEKFSAPNALILAGAAAVAYDDADACQTWARDNGFDEEFDFFSNIDTQGFVAQNASAVLVAFRGTEPNRPLDWLSDAKIRAIPWDHRVGRVHHGFYSALRAVWNQTIGGKQILPKRLLDRGDRSVWITGHSLGGALAKLCAAQATLVSGIPVEGVYTFGQPRVGDEEFSRALNEALGKRIVRMVNDRDIVPRVPLFGMRFRHCGGQLFFFENDKSEDSDSAVEDLAAALRLALRGLELDPIREAARLIRKATIRAFLTGDIRTMTDELSRAQEMKTLGDLHAILGRGIENISDHDMKKCYLVRLSALAQAAGA